MDCLAGFVPRTIARARADVGGVKASLECMLAAASSGVRSRRKGLSSAGIAKKAPGVKGGTSIEKPVKLVTPLSVIRNLRTISALFRSMVWMNL